MNFTPIYGDRHVSAGGSGINFGANYLWAPDGVFAHDIVTRQSEDHPAPGPGLVEVLDRMIPIGPEPANTHPYHPGFAYATRRLFEKLDNEDSVTEDAFAIMGDINTEGETYNNSYKRIQDLSNEVSILSNNNKDALSGGWAKYIVAVRAALGLGESTIYNKDDINVATNGNLKTNIDNVVNLAIADAKNSILQATTDSRNDASTAFSSANTDAKAYTSTIVSNKDSTIKTDVNAQVATAKASGETNADSSIVAADSKATLLSSNIMHEADQDAKSDITNLVENAINDILNGTPGKLGDIFTEAQTQAQSMINTTAINDVVDSLEASESAEHARSVNRFAGGMAANNSVNSSAFFIGLAMMESDKVNRLSKARADLNLKTYEQTLPLFVQSFQGVFNKQIDAYISELQTYIGTYNNILPQYMNTFLGTFSQYLQTYLKEASDYLGVYTTLNTNHTNSAVSQAGQQIGANNELVNSALSAYLSVRGSWDNGRNQFINQSPDHMTRADGVKLAAMANVATIQEGHDQFLVAAKTSEAISDQEYRVSSAMWQISVLQEASNVLATSSGGMRATPQKPSFGQQLLSAGVQALANTVAAAAIASDEILKDNIEPIESPLDKISKIGGYEFDWNDKQTLHQGHDVGVIAQEIEKVFPSLVVTNPNGFKAVKYEKIIPLLIESIKDQQSQIDELKMMLEEVALTLPTV